MWVALLASVGVGLGIYWMISQTAAVVTKDIPLIRNLTLRPPRVGQKHVNSLEEKLRRFPLTRTWKVQDFYLLQIICAVCAALAYALPGFLVIGLRADPAATFFVFAVAFFLPYALLLLALKRRFDRLGRAVYDLLSHLVLQMAAHKNTMLAFQTAPRAVRDPLREELQHLLADLKLRPMQPALEAFADRTGHPYLKDFAQAVVYQRSLSIDVEEVFRHQEDLYRRNLREKARTRAKIYEAAVAGAAMFLLGNGMFMWMYPTMTEFTRTMNLF